MLLTILDMIGTIAFATSGALAAIRHRMDLSGAIVLAFIVGNGGGTVRDMLLERPIFWFHEHNYIYVAVATGLITFLIAYFVPKTQHHRAKDFEWSLILSDAIGLAAFTIIGINVTLSLGYGILIAIIMGLLTAVGGGVIRDIMCREIPLIFHGQLYATPALLGAILYVTLLHYAPHELAIATCIIVVLTIRILAVKKAWHLPFV